MHGPIAPKLMTLSRPPVLVLGSGLTVLGVIRLLCAAGFQPLVVNGERDVAKNSKCYRPAPASRGAAPDVDFDDYLDGLPLERAILMPCSDKWILRAAQRSASLRKRFPASLSEADALDELIDKLRLSEL